MAGVEGLEEEKPQHECGVFGILCHAREAARLTFFGLFALQHRGQESAGIATCHHGVMAVHKAMGLVRAESCAPARRTGVTAHPCTRRNNAHVCPV